MEMDAQQPMLDLGLDRESEALCGYQGIEKGPHAPRQSVEDAILEAIPKSGQGYARVNATSIARACGVHQSTVSRALYRMVSDGVLEFAYPRRYRRSAVSRGSTLRRDDLALLLDLQDRVAALSERMDQVERTVNAGLERMDQSLHDLMALMRSVLDTAQPRFTETRTPRIDTEPTFAPAIETAAVNGDGSSASCLPDAEASIDQEPSHTDGVQESKRRARSTTSRTQVINLDDVSSMKGAVRFEEFWQEYPRHERKKDAVRHWISQKLDDKADQIIDDVRMRKAYSKAWNTGYAPHAATYLNGQRWTDSIDFLKPSDQCIVLANTPQEKAIVEQMIEEFGLSEVNETAQDLIRRGMMPYPSRVLKALQEMFGETHDDYNGEEDTRKMGYELGYSPEVVESVAQWFEQEQERKRAERAARADQSRARHASRVIDGEHEPLTFPEGWENDPEWEIL